jgi:hypothetical protein
LIWSVPSSCGYLSEKFLINGIDDITRKLSNLSSRCFEIKTLSFAGHGLPGSQTIGDQEALSRSESHLLQPYSCMMAKNAEIYFLGCSVGVGCRGDIFLDNIAKDLLYEKGGVITAATANRISFMPRLIPVLPSFSMNGVVRKLTYNPQKNPPETWDLSGLARSNGGLVGDNCSNEFIKLKNQLKQAMSSAKTKGCALDSSSGGYFYLSENAERFHKMEHLYGAVNINTFDDEDVSWTISVMSENIETLNQCQPSPNLQRASVVK